MIQMPEIHTTDLGTWKRCRRKWALSELARLLPAKKSMALMLGSAVHKSLEVWYETEDPSEAIDALRMYIDEDTSYLRENYPWLYAEQEADILEHIDLGEQMMAGYFEQYAVEEFKIARAGGKKLLEIDFEVPIYTPAGKVWKGYTYHGTIDGVIVDEYGYWLLEHKTTGYTNADYIRVADQNVMYLAFAQEQWPKIVPHLRGVYYNFLRKQRPSSRVKSPLFFRERIYRNQHEIGAAVASIYFVVKDMERAAKNPDDLCYTTATKDCSWDCHYKTICLAMNDGTDVDSLIEANFIIEDESRSKWVSDWAPQNREA